MADAAHPEVAITVADHPIILRVREQLEEAAIAYAIADADADDSEDLLSVRVLIAAGLTYVDAALLERLPGLEVVVRTGAGFDKVDVEQLRRHSIALVNSSLPEESSVAQWTIGAALALSRQYAAADAAVRRGDYFFRWRSIGSSLTGREIGLIGMGRIGTQVAKFAECFGMQVSAWHPWSDRSLPVRRHDDLDTLLASADFVSLHCRLTDDTRNLINAEALATMKGTAFLLNSARGGIVDEPALVDALRTGSIAGAAVDTFVDEPDVGSSCLIEAPNSILTPHVAASTEQSIHGVASYAAGVAGEYLNTGSLPERNLIVPR